MWCHIGKAIPTGFLAMLAAGILGTASAAPQMLVLLENGGRTPLQCRGESCVAELAAMCLQPERHIPRAGRAYTPLDGQKLLVTGQDHDGRALRLPVPPTAKLAALRSHLSVRLEVSKPWLQRHFRVVDGVVVAQAAVLRPEAEAGDERPITIAEEAEAATRAQSTARDAFAAHPGSVLTARISNYVINALPRDRDVDDKALVATWRAAVAEMSDPGADLTTARFAVDYCQYSARNGLADSLHTCLQGRQDRALEDVHQGYVDALATGS